MPHTVIAGFVLAIQGSNLMVMLVALDPRNKSEGDCRGENQALFFST